jgi:tetratricopeptide (TPR) repeat protein/predicted Ser/Thr protein kinase
VKQVGRYQIAAEVARGGAGVVYRAQDPGTGRTVAIKRMLHLGSEVARKRFKREAEALARVEHPNVVRLYDYDLTPAAEPYMVMEWIEGESLQSRLDRCGPLPLEEALSCAKTLCGAVAACHAAGVLHRDLKPDNVVVGRDGCLKLIDFGLVRDTDPSTSRSHLSVKGKFLGTPGFWSPEQARGKLDLLGPATDVYGLGATLFALLTDRPPHQGSTLVEILNALSTPKEPASALNPAVPEWLDGVVASALAIEPADRFADVEELLAGLRGATDGSTQPAAPAAMLVSLGLTIVGILVALGVVTTARGQASAGAASASATPSEPEVLPRTASPPLPPAEEVSAAAAAFARGVAHFENRHYEDAIEDFDEAIRLQPDLASAYFNRGSARGSLGDVRGAIADFGHAIRLGPDRADAYLSRAHTWEALEEWRAAVDDYTEVLRLRPRDAVAYLNRGASRGRLGDNVGAIADCGEAIRLQPDFADAYMNRGAARVSDGDLKGGIEDLEQALDLELDPGSARSARKNLVIALRLLGEQQGGGSGPEVADKAQAGQELGAQHFIAGRYPEAIEAFDEVIRIRPDVSYPYFGRAKAQASLGNDVAALQDYDRAIRLNPDNANAFCDRGALREKLGDYRGAIEDSTEALRLQPDSALVYRNRALARNKLGDLLGAVSDYGEAIRLEPESARAFANRGSTYHQLRRWPEAIADLERALELGIEGTWAETIRENLSSARRALSERSRSQD